MTPRVAELLDQAVGQVLWNYPLVPLKPSCESLGNHGGFSGASLWRVASPAGPLCLRAWPEGRVTADYLAGLHDLIRSARSTGLHFLPDILATTSGKTFVFHLNRFWEVSTWMPGRADFHEMPTANRLNEACEALARIHVCWQTARPTAIGEEKPCPAIQRRLATYLAWNERVRSGWRPNWESSPALIRPLGERAWRLTGKWVGHVPGMLQPWIDRPVPLQMCLGDVWHDHLLFEGDRLTGLIDFGSVKRDHVAVDLARMLGSMIGDSGKKWQVGLTAYQRIRRLNDDEIALVHALDRSGAILALVNWLTWIYVEKREYEDYRAVAARMEEGIKACRRA